VQTSLGSSLCRGHSFLILPPQPEAIALREWLVREDWSNLFLDLDPQRGIAAGESLFSLITRPTTVDSDRVSAPYELLFRLKIRPPPIEQEKK